MKHGFYTFFIDDQDKFIEMKDKNDFSFFRKFTQIIWSVYGLINFYLYFTTEDSSKLILATFGVLWFIMFLVDLKKSYIPVIHFQNIESVKYKSCFLEKTLVLKLKNSKKKVIPIELTNEKLQLLMTIFKESNIVFETKY